jgi:tetratricopeptide (TPR) repeat protein
MTREKTMKTILRLLLAATLFVAVSMLPLGAVLQDEAREGSADMRDLLDSVRDDLVEMRFDKALAAIEALLGQPGMTQAERGEALVLRAQAHAAFGDFDAVEEDYREILRIRPGYAPEGSLTPTKAMERYNKVKSQMIGRIQLTIDPADAQLFVDGESATPDPTGLLMLLAGTHTLRSERRGHDPLEVVVEVTADKETPVQLELIPNARTVVLRTEPDGVDVTLDGQLIGRTARAEETVGAGAPAAELVVEAVPLGEHVFELRKECFRAERLTDTLAVDLLDRSPKRYQTVRMVPSHSRVVLTGGPSGAEVLIDGSKVAGLPAESIESCPGSREIAVTLRGRVVWMETTDLREADEKTLAVEPRPNVVLVGTEEWSSSLAEFGSGFNIVGRLERPEQADLGAAESWTGLRMPPDVDLVFGVEPSTRQGAADHWYLYSPILREVIEIEAAPPVRERPVWSTVTWGFAVIDTTIGGAGRVVEVIPGGPAEDAGLATGDRVREVAGREVADSQQIRSTLAEVNPDRPIRIKWLTVDGEEREAEITGRVGPLLIPRHERPDVAMVHAAWAELDSVLAPAQAPAAMANLGLLFAEFGHHELAEDIWRRVDWGNRTGVGEGTKQYYLGRAMEFAGRETEAIAAYKKAAASDSTAFTDDGPPIAPAALDRLADLGVVTK